jgi:hypothetical protein
MITINNDLPNSEEPVFLYSQDDQFIGQIKNDLAFLDVRLQIAKSEFPDNVINPYYIIHKNNRHFINRKGQVSNRSDFDEIFPLYVKLLEDILRLN